MEPLLLIMGIVVVVWMLFRRVPQPHIIYIHTEPHSNGGLGCLPLIIIGLIVLLALGMVRF